MEVVGSSSGVSVYRVYRGSVAEQVGLVRNDVLLSVGPTRVIDLEHFVEAILRVPEETSVTLEIFRDGQVFRQRTQLGEGEMESVTLPPDPAPTFSPALSGPPSLPAPVFR
jgi:S1-C subfamily serine protease